MNFGQNETDEAAAVKESIGVKLAENQPEGEGILKPKRLDTFLIFRDATAKTLNSENVFLSIINKDQKFKIEIERNSAPKQQNFLMPRISSTSGLPDAF